MKLALVIPAAGAASRLGTCKALAQLGPRTALEHILANGVEPAEPRPLVITGAHHREIAAVAPATIELLENPDWAAGRTGGLQLAARARPGHDLVIAPVDCPLVPRAVFAALRAGWLAAGAPERGWLAPRLAPRLVPRLVPLLAPRLALGAARARYGHPLILGRGLVDELLELAPDASLRQLRAAAQPAFGIDVPHIEILDDLDRPNDLARLADRASDDGDGAPK